jgi:hypothetical protein
MTEEFRQNIPAAPPAAVFLPKEHGSWSLALEPLGLGLLVAPSVAGLALALAAVAGLFVRRPLKAALTHAVSGRRREARRPLGLLSAAALAGLGEAFVLGGPGALWPLGLAAPFGGLFLWFDAQNESRAAAAEIAGSTMFALLPAAMATLAGWPAPAALALSAIALGRSLPTILAVRAYLRLTKQQPADPFAALSAGTGALLALAFLAQAGLVPWLAVGWSGLLLLRLIWYVTSLRPVWSARRVGITEAVIGLIYIGTLTAVYRS